LGRLRGSGISPLPISHETAQTIVEQFAARKTYLSSTEVIEIIRSSASPGRPSAVGARGQAQGLQDRERRNAYMVDPVYLAAWLKAREL
jgi:hypothetical protein